MNQLWQSRLKVANRAFDQWETEFNCKSLVEYYEGKHWKYNSQFTPRPYTVNLVYATIKIKAANLLLSYPKYLITPKPGNSDYNLEAAVMSAQLKEDTLNTVVGDDLEAFQNAMHLCFLDSQFRFGVMEVGYASEWLRNPLAARPLLNAQETTVGEETPTIDIDKLKIERMPDELPEHEKIYFKRVPAARFRVGTKDAQELSRCDWVGYYEFVMRADLEVIDSVKSEYLKNSAGYSSQETIEFNNSVTGTSEKETHGDILKIWHVWDVRAKKRFLILDTPCEVIWEDDFKRLPLFDLRWDLRTRGWYPIPPVYQWTSPQDEYNEAREMMRQHRKRFGIRKFQVVGDMIEQEEIDKFTNSEDGTIIRVPQKDAISPIQNPELGASAKEALIISKDDFNEVSGTSSADRGRADRTTATESQRLGMKADIRDSAEDALVLTFMSKLGREALLLMRERFTTGVWAMLNNDPQEDFLGEVQENPSYQWVTSEQLDDGYDFRVSVEVISASPVRNDEEEKKFIKFLSIVQNFPQIALSPLLVREAAYRSGYRNERVIREMQKMATLTMLGAQQQAQQNASGGNLAQTQVAQMTPPTQEQITNQLQNQVVQ